jgi:WhiB family redox-sensing transcriptional regulator
MQVDSRREPARGPDWPQFGACGDEDPELFFADDDEGLASRAMVREALAVCARCPVMAGCRGHALQTPERFGIWGGLTAGERRAMLAALDGRRAGSAA